MSIADLVAELAEAGANPRVISIAVRALEARDNAERDRKSKRAEQKRNERSRDKVATVARQSDDVARQGSDNAATVATEVSAPIPPYEIINSTPPTPPSSSVSARERTSAADEVFASRFWPVWPHKVGKPEATKAFRKVAGEIDAIVAGVERYIATKPLDRQFMNPATFLNGRRWEDEAAASGPERPPPGHRSSNAREAQAEFFTRMMYENDERPSSGFANDKTIDGVASRETEGASPLPERGRDDAEWSSGGFGIVTALRR